MKPAFCRVAARYVAPIVLLVGIVLGRSSAHAQIGDVAQVSYSPVIREVQGTLPYGTSYTLTITSPSSLTTSATIGFSKVINSIPAGADSATAVSYVSISPSTVGFTGPNQTRQVKVSFEVPVDAVPGTYSYQLYTNGWPSGMSATNAGSSINGTVSLPPVPVPPSITIGTPTNGSEYVVRAPATLPFDLDFAFTAVASGAAISNITAIDADHNGAAISLKKRNLNTLSATGTGTLSITRTGTHTVNARATNAAGTVSASNTFTVRVEGPPPEVMIDTPTLDQVYQIAAGAITASVPFRFTAAAPSGTTIKTMEAWLTLEGAAENPISFATSGLNTTSALGTATFPVGATGRHRLRVRTTNEYGEASATQTFIVNRVVSIRADNKIKAYGAAVPALTATAVGLPGTVTLDSLNVTLSLATTATATSPVEASGYPITVSGPGEVGNYRFAYENGTLSVTQAPLLLVATNASREVGEANPVFNYEAVGLVVAGDNKENVLNSGVVLTTDATVNSAAGLYPIRFANAGTLQSRNYGLSFKNGVLTVGNPVTSGTVGGLVFLDATNAARTLPADGLLQSIEPGLAGIEVWLKQADGVERIVLTGSSGRFEFTNVPAGSYSIDVREPGGMWVTTVLPVTFSQPRTDFEVGLWLNFEVIGRTRGYGRSHGYWKENVMKARDNITKGVQETFETITALTNQIRALALSPFSELAVVDVRADLTPAVNILSGKNQLELQLLAAEYNYARGYLIGGDNPSVYGPKALTFAFVAWGEYASLFGTPAEKNTAKDWLDAFNNSYGGTIGSPR